MGDGSSNHGGTSSLKYVKGVKKTKKPHNGSTNKQKYGSDQEELPPIGGKAIKPKKAKYNKTSMFPAFKKK